MTPQHVTRSHYEDAGEVVVKNGSGLIMKSWVLDPFWRATCRCGWLGEKRPDVFEALYDRNDHLVETGTFQR